MSTDHGPSIKNDEQYERGQELEVDGRSGMDKGELIEALRST